MMDIYIKPVEKVQVIGRRNVRLGDIADVLIGGQTKGEIEGLVILQIPQERDKTYLISVLEVVQVINQSYPDATVSNLGEMDILVEYHQHPKKQNKPLEWAKVVFVAVILFVGASTTIMSFHSDAQLPLIFENYYYMFFGENKDVPAMLSIPYSVGLAVGIMIFFNHFSKISLTDDPTPIQVEMTTYEKETNASVVDYLYKQKTKGGKGA